MEHLILKSCLLKVKITLHYEPLYSLLHLCLALRTLEGPQVLIHVDLGPGFQALPQDKVLRKYQICLEIGRKKNIIKNPVADRAVQEV